MKSCCSDGKRNINPKNWVGNSRFLFYLSIVLFLSLMVGIFYVLYTYHYKGKPKVEVPMSSSSYNPAYK